MTSATAITIRDIPRTGSVGKPSDGDHDEGPGEADKRADQTDTGPDDVGDERNHLGESLDEAEDALQTSDHKEYTQNSEDPEPDLVGRVLTLVHLVGGLHTHLKHAERLAVLGREWHERVAADLSHKGYLSRKDLCEGHAHITDLRSTGIGAEADHIVLNLDSKCGVYLAFLLEQFVGDPFAVLLREDIRLIAGNG